MKLLANFGAVAVALILRANGHVTFPDDYEFVVAADEARSLEGQAQAPLRSTQNACKLPGPWDRPVQLGLGFGPMTAYAPSVGRLKTAMFFVDFPDAPANDTPRSLYDGLMPGAAEWYNASSYGRLTFDLKVDLSRFYRMPSASTTYQWTRALTGPIHVKYIADGLAAVGDRAMFGNIDVLYIVPTRAAKEISFSPTYMGGVALADGTTIGKTVTFGQDLWTRWGYKVLNHETGHAFGLPDLYPIDNLGLPTTYWVGGWDIMGLIAGTAPDFFSWHKWKLSWIDDSQVSCISASGTSQHLLSPLSETGGTKMVAVKLNQTCALAMELRTRQGLDVNTCSEGLLLYIVDVTKSTGQGPIVVLDPRTIKALACAPSNGGQLTSAAMNAAKGETNIDLPDLGVTVRTEVQGNYYKLSVDYTATQDIASEGGDEEGDGDTGTEEGDGDDDHDRY